MKFLTETDQGTQVRFTNMSAGCLIIPGIIMFAGSILALWLTSNDSGLSVAFGYAASIIGILFFGGCLIKIFFLTISKNPILFEIKSEAIIDRKGKVIPFTDIEEIFFGWHHKRFTGMVFQEVVIQQKNKKYSYIPTYNMIPDDVVIEVLESKVIPHVSPSCNQAWVEFVKSKGKQKVPDTSEKTINK